MQAPPGIASLAARIVPEDGLRIMPLGDSLTDGLTIPGGYRVELWRQIAAVGDYTDHFVSGSLENGPGDLPERRHEGHSGLRIDQIQEHAAKWVSSAQPDVVLLMIGTNDVLQAYDLPGAKDRLARLVDTILAAAPGVRLLLATLPPDEAAERRDARIQIVAFRRLRRRGERASRSSIFMRRLRAHRDCSRRAIATRRSRGIGEIGDMWWSAIRALSPWTSMRMQSRTRSIGSDYGVRRPYVEVPVSQV